MYQKQCSLSSSAAAAAVMTVRLKTHSSTRAHASAVYCGCTRVLTAAALILRSCIQSVWYCRTAELLSYHTTNSSSNQQQHQQLLLALGGRLLHSVTARARTSFACHEHCCSYDTTTTHGRKLMFTSCAVCALACALCAAAAAVTAVRLPPLKMSACWKL
jgi:hypothetical protein